jgi:hypothetical protein
MQNTTGPVGGQPKYQRSLPCEGCGDMCESGYYDLAFHDCDEGEWHYINLALDGPGTAPKIVLEGE